VLFRFSLRHPHKCVIEIELTNIEGGHNFRDFFKGTSWEFVEKVTRSVVRKEKQVHGNSRKEDENFACLRTKFFTFDLNLSFLIFAWLNFGRS
jgi:hypothetical protein